MLVAQRAQAPQELHRAGADAALALDRLDADAAGGRRDGGAHGVEVAERHLIEAVQQRVEAMHQLLLLGGRDGGQRAAVEGLLEGDDAVLLRVAGFVMILADGLGAAFPRFRTRIGEEHGIGEGDLGQALGKALLPGDPEQVGGVPQLVRLLGQLLHQIGMRVTQRVHRDAGGEIEESSPVGRVEIRTLTTLEHDVGAGVCGHNDGDHGFGLPKKENPAAMPDRREGQISGDRWVLSTDRGENALFSQRLHALSL